MVLNPGDFETKDTPGYFRDHFIQAVVERLPDQKQLLLLFDEFDVLGEEADIEDEPEAETFAYKQFIPFITAWIEALQVKEYPVKFIFAVGRNYKDLDSGRFGQILKFGSKEELSYFSREETGESLKLSDNLIAFDEEAINEVFSLTSGHPYFTQCLAGVSFGNFLIKNVVELLNKEISGIKSFVTLSPVPGFRRWLKSADLEGLVDDALADKIREPVGRAVEGEVVTALSRLCAHYLIEVKSGPLAKDPVAHESVMIDYLIAEQEHHGINVISHEFLHDAAGHHNLGEHEHRSPSGKYTRLKYVQVDAGETF